MNDKRLKMLCVLAHPDDESLGTGGPLRAVPLRALRRISSPQHAAKEAGSVTRRKIPA